MKVYDPFKHDPMYRAHALADNKVWREMTKVDNEILLIETRLADLRAQRHLLEQQSKSHREYTDYCDRHRESMEREMIELVDQ